ncbi:unnamed protein product, partial [Leptosia nina]
MYSPKPQKCQGGNWQSRVQIKQGLFTTSPVFGTYCNLTARRIP